MSTPEEIRYEGQQEDCKMCDGEGSFWKKEEGGSLSGSRTLCRRCLGTRKEVK
ncbi:hypothetical protein LCGC14_2307420 [marine sediment metagenome]|uniref:Uncharacterized protein n=1 Tax=marine sediment metagenome TaxID=412755 RepID=A0A0F9D985_9ZZZZ